MGLYIGNEKIGGGLITKVNALPEANATNYAKNQLYLYENKLYFIVLDGSTYKYKKLGYDTIQFTINGYSYQADSGMTWGQWCDSAYNTIGAHDNGGSIYVDSPYPMQDSNGNFVSGTDLIIANEAYTYLQGND